MLAPTSDSPHLESASPKHYSLTIKTDLVAKTFSGTVEITLSLLCPIPAGAPIVLNVAAPLKLHAVVLAQAGLVRRASSISPVEGKERVEFRFDGGAIEAGAATLALRFDGELNRSMKGYYLSAYPSKDGHGESFYAVTQFQPTHARRAFVTTRPTSLPTQR